MKVSIGSPIIQGPYGGGNLFVKNLSKYLFDQGHEVVFGLKDKDIDIIIITNPLKYSEVSIYNQHDVNFYLKFINPNALVVQRINECDERKDTNNVNIQILEANKCADYTIFVSNWIKRLYEEKGISKKNSRVILSGSDENIFFIRKNFEKNVGNKKLKLVTHHWSSNWKKGFDIYIKIDELLDKPEWSSLIEFTYIGNLPKGILFKNIKHFPPKTDIQLGEVLNSYDGYITASINEPSGNHHIEAAQSGLPILYLESGGIPEYCEGYGIGFNSSNFELKLKEFINKNKFLKKNMTNYPNNATKSNEAYLELFDVMIKNKNNFLNSRFQHSKVKVLYNYSKNIMIKILFFMYLKFIYILKNLVLKKVKL